MICFLCFAFFFSSVGILKNGYSGIIDTIDGGFEGTEETDGGLGISEYSEGIEGIDDSFDTSGEGTEVIEGIVTSDDFITGNEGNSKNLKYFDGGCFDTFDCLGKEPIILENALLILLELGAFVISVEVGSIYFDG